MPILSETPRKALSTPRLTPHTCCRPTKAIPTILGGESGSHSGLDSDLLSVLSFLMGGLSPLLGLEPVLFRERVHRLTVYTLVEDTSVEWAMEPFDTGNASRLDELLNGAPAGADLDRWEDYREKMWEVASLRRSQEQVDKYGQLVRECAALSLSLFEERG